MSKVLTTNRLCRLWGRNQAFHAFKSFTVSCSKICHVSLLYRGEKEENALRSGLSVWYHNVLDEVCTLSRDPLYVSLTPDVVKILTKVRRLPSSQRFLRCCYFLFSCVKRVYIIIYLLGNLYFGLLNCRA